MQHLASQVHLKIVLGVSCVAHDMKDAHLLKYFLRYYKGLSSCVLMILTLLSVFYHISVLWKKLFLRPGFSVPSNSLLIWKDRIWKKIVLESLKMMYQNKDAIFPTKM